MFVKDMKFPLLLDAYGALLSERRREMLEYYYDDDYSLAEIAELAGLSRQGVRDSIKKGEEELYAYEEKLGLVRESLRRETVTDEIASLLAALKESARDETTRKAADAILEKLEALGSRDARKE